MGTCPRPLDFRDSVLMPCTGFFHSCASIFSHIHGSHFMDGQYVGGWYDAAACYSSGSPPRVTSIAHYKPRGRVSNCKN